MQRRRGPSPLSPASKSVPKETAHGDNCNTSLIVTCIYNNQAIRQAGQGRAGQGRAGQGRAGQDKQGRAGQARQAGKKRNRRADKLRSTNFL